MQARGRLSDASSPAGSVEGGGENGERMHDHNNAMHRSETSSPEMEHAGGPAQTGPPPAAGEGQLGDQLMAILQDVEQQFDRLAVVQNTESSDVERSSERAQQLERQEMTLREQAERLRQQGEHLASEWSRLEEQRRELEARAASSGGEGEEAVELARRAEQAEANVGELIRQLEETNGKLQRRDEALAKALRRKEDLKDQLAERRWSWPGSGSTASRPRTRPSSWPRKQKKSAMSCASRSGSSRVNTSTPRFSCGKPRTR